MLEELINTADVNHDEQTVTVKRRGRPKKDPQQNFFADLSDENVQLVDDTQQDRPSEYVPDMSDPDWTEYVLSLLQPNEMVKGKYPNVPGIRRLIPKLLGKILRSESTVQQVPTPDNSYSCVITHTLEIRDFAGDLLVFSGSTDLCKANANAPFDRHIVSSTDSRSEGKALRRALKLSVVLAEELDTEDKSGNQGDKITDSQITFIDSLCSRNKLNVQKVVQKFYDVNVINKLSYEQAADINSKISAFQRDYDNIPAELKGYDNEWRKVFQS